MSNEKLTPEEIEELIDILQWYSKGDRKMLNVKQSDYCLSLILQNQYLIQKDQQPAMSAEEWLDNNQVRKRIYMHTRDSVIKHMQAYAHHYHESQLKAEMEEFVEFIRKCKEDVFNNGGKLTGRTQSLGEELLKKHQ